MALRWGFKTEATSIATAVRQDLGVGPLDRLDPFELALSLEIPVVGLSEMRTEAPAVVHLLEVETDVFSAVTVFAGPRRLIVHNDGHASVRQHSNVSHELSHGLLQHPPTAALDDTGCRQWDADVEDEASWLAGCLLMTEEATFKVARGQWSAAEAASRLQVSQDMVRFRVNKTGAKRRVKRIDEARRSRRG